MQACGPARSRPPFFANATQGHQDGQHRVRGPILALGAEKMVSPDKERMRTAFDGAWDVASPQDNAERLVALGLPGRLRDAGVPRTLLARASRARPCQTRWCH